MPAVGAGRGQSGTQPPPHENRLGSIAAHGTDGLAAIVKNRFKRIQYWPALIDGFAAQTGLTLETGPP